MLISKNVTIKWNSRNVNYYKDLGYNYTKIGDEFIVNVNDLPIGSHCEVEIKCDYCGKIFVKRWNQYIQSKNNEYIQKDCCKDCCNLKNKEVIKKKYDVDCISDIIGVKEKRIQTNIERYGSENVFASSMIKEKIKETNIEKYGVENPMQCKEILDKVLNTTFEKYGVYCYLNLDYIGDNIRGENSPVWKGGIRTERTERLTEQYRIWRMNVFAKDNFICQKCSEHNNKLNAHHICNWKDCIDVRYDIENGITLCEDCHKEFHKIYGKNNNTLQQIEEFLK